MTEKQTTYPQDEEHNRIFEQLEAYLKKESPHLDPNFRCPDLPAIIGTNERYLQAAVVRATGLTLQDYLLRLRVRYAANELIIPDDTRTIEQVAFASGFTTNRTFRRNFKRLLHQTPQEFRETHRQKWEEDETYTDNA